MNPYPYGPTSNNPMYQQPPPIYPPPATAYPPPATAYPPPATAYPPPTVGVYPPPATVPVAMPPPAIFGGMQFIYVQDPMTELASCPSLLIRQEPEFLETMTGCEMPNIYHVFGRSPLGFRYLFKCMEKSSCFSRKFCPSTNRPMDLDIIHCNSIDQLGMGYTTPFAIMRKPYMCTMCCLCRPEINVTLSSSGKNIGKIIHTFTLCDPTFDLYDSTGTIKYIVTGSCCQCALLCPGILGKTDRGLFDILEAGTNTKVGTITKEPANLSELVTDADTYIVNFPPNANANDKLLLMGLTLLLDYQYFETDADEGRKNRHGSRGHRGGGRIKIKMGGRR